MKVRPLIGVAASLVCALLLVGAAPAANQARGTLVVAVDLSAAPWSSVDPGGAVVGLDADLAQALANVIGYRVRVVEASPGAIVPGLVSGEYDVGMPVADTPAHERVADVVPYLAGTAFYATAKSAPVIKTLSSLCGRSVAAVRGSAQAAAAAAQSAKCRAAGRPALRLSLFASSSGAQGALSSGRVQLATVNASVAARVVQRSNGRFRLAGPTTGGDLQTLAIARSSGLADELLDALQTVMADGTYDSILARWGAHADALGRPVVNPAAG
jgi:polar amino acid transport system substrate-binding protein